MSHKNLNFNEMAVKTWNLALFWSVMYQLLSFNFFFLDCFVLEDVKDRLTQNVGEKLPFYVV